PAVFTMAPGLSAGFYSLQQGFHGDHKRQRAGHHPSVSRPWGRGRLIHGFKTEGFQSPCRRGPGGRRSGGFTTEVTGFATVSASLATLIQAADPGGQRSADRRVVPAAGVLPAPRLAAAVA